MEDRVWVRMLVDMQGSRHDDQLWPGFKNKILLPAWEAADLIANQTAEPLDAEDVDRGWNVLQEPSLTWDQPPAEEEEALFNSNGHRDPHATGVIDEDDFRRDEEEDDDFDRDEPAPVVKVKKPYGNSSKGDWIKYAVSHGADAQAADKLTKAQLVSEFGNL